jgi:hypothetical protein
VSYATAAVTCITITTDTTSSCTTAGPAFDEEECAAILQQRLETALQVYHTGAD